MLTDLFQSYPLLTTVCQAVVLLVVGVLAIRIVDKILKVSLEKTKLEKAAHSLITSLANAAMYVLLPTPYSEKSRRVVINTLQPSSSKFFRSGSSSQSRLSTINKV